MTTKPASEERARMILSYRYKLLPTKAQHRRLKGALEHSRQLYNAALEERIDCYRKTGKGRSYFDQTAALTQWRQEVGTPYAWSMEAAPLKAVALAYAMFFKRGGFPRFKSRDRFNSIAFNDIDAWRIRDGRLVAKGLGAIRVHMHRPLPSAVKMCKIKRQGRDWYINIFCEIECSANDNDATVGIDMGITTLAALSNGEMIENIRPYKRAMRLLKVRQRALARCKRGSKNRKAAKARLAAAHMDIRHQRDTHLHQVSADLTKRFGLIAVEKLNVKGLASSMLSKGVHDASWTKLRDMLRYKAERAGGVLVEVNPRGTSQTCPECGQIKAKALSERVHRCDCGCTMDRDVAAAKVVLLRAVNGPGELNAGGYVERVRGKAAA